MGAFCDYNVYQSDAPIKTSKGDVLGRNVFAQNLAQAITKSRFEDTMCIGLHGKWGVGKTSIINMVLEEINELPAKDRPVIVRFEPWLFSSSEDLIKQFLMRLSTEFCKKNKALKNTGESIKQYANSFGLAKNILPLIPGVPAVLVPILSTLGQDAAKQLGDALSESFDAESMDIQKQKEKVIKALSKQNKRVLIVIDDIDRLNSEQIRQIFQLVASVAHFPKTIYLLSFDYDVVVKSLEEVQGGDGNEYLKKVIQISMEVPEVSTDKVEDILLKRLDELISEYDIKRTFNQEHWFNVYPYCIAPFISDLRDVNRLCNLLRFKLINISDDIDFADMTGLTAIELFCPLLYNWIKNNRYRLVNTPTFSSAFSYNKQPTKEQWTAELKQLLESGYQSQNTFDENKYFKCVSALFPQLDRVSYHDNSIARKNNYISHSDKMDRYFQLNIGDSAISVKELNQVLNIFNQTQLEEMLKRLSESKRIIDFFRELSVHKSEITPRRAEIIFRSILKISPDLEKVNHKFLGLAPFRDAHYILEELIECLQRERRVAFLCECMNDLTLPELSSLALIVIVNDINKIT